MKNALETAPEEIKDRVIVVAIAPGAVVPRRLCFKSFNYASEKDFVYKLEPAPPRPFVPGIVDDVIIPRFGDAPPGDREELIILTAHPDATGFDHEFQSPTFHIPLERIIANYKQHEGEYLPTEKGTRSLEAQ